MGLGRWTLSTGACRDLLVHVFLDCQEMQQAATTISTDTSVRDTFTCLLNAIEETLTLLYWMAVLETMIKLGIMMVVYFLVVIVYKVLGVYLTGQLFPRPSEVSPLLHDWLAGFK